MRKTIGDQLLDLKNRSELSLAEIARLAGYKGASSLQRYFNPAYDPEVLDYRTAQKLAEAMEGAGEPEISQYEIMALTAAADQAGIRPVLVPMQASKDMKGIIPVYYASTMKISFPSINNGFVEGLYLDFADPVDNLRCPPVLERRDVIGFYMAGASMRPRFNPGEIVFTDGRKPASIGEDVLVFIKDHQETDSYKHPSIFGRLKDAQQEFLVLEQYSGTSFSIPLSQVDASRRVMHAEELLGNVLI